MLLPGGFRCRIREWMREAGYQMPYNRSSPSGIKNVPLKVWGFADWGTGSNEDQEFNLYGARDQADMAFLEK
ncbi:hypothetical protein L2E82_20319 [Cichorium intybus]|uniref:Uncharacterized protein n=1 Tax=Cichorium intybus TaxID=13427 RepID=A0ACB9DTR4_CICIN|nr:hypothetical protein L2E82_20319 [Cichorium intybus]